MTMIVTGLIIIAFAWIYYWIAGIRNNFVWQLRSYILRVDRDNYDSMVSYEEMYRKFWKWDVFPENWRK